MNLIFIYGSCFGLLGIWKSSFLGILCSITPLLRVQVLPRSPYGLIPLVSCIASPTNQRTDLFCEFGSFFLFSPFFLGTFSGYFWPPLCLYLRQRSPYGPQLRISSFELGISKKIKDLDYWLFQYIQYMEVFARLGSSFSPLLKPKVPP